MSDKKTPAETFDNIMDSNPVSPYEVTSVLRYPPEHWSMEDRLRFSELALSRMIDGLSR